MRLTEPERQHLWRRCKAGDRTARDQLIDSYHHLAPLTVRKSVPHVPYSIEYDDLCQEANIALIRAVDQFDPTRGVTFSSYAITLMRSACLEYLRREDWVPRSRRDLAKLLERAEIKAQSEHPDRLVTEAEIAAVLGWDKDRLAQRRREAAAVAVVSLSAILYDRDRERGRDDFLVLDRVADPKPEPCEDYCAGEWRAALRAAVGCLPAAQRQAILGRYFERRNNPSLGRERGLSNARIQQLHDAGVKNLRRLLKRHAREWFADAA